MSAILALCILVLGYHYVNQAPAERATLKRGNNWEVYAILLKHGLFYMLFGALLTLGIFVFLIVGFLVIQQKNNVNVLIYIPYFADVKNFPYFWQMATSIFATSAFLLGWCSLKIREYRSKDYWQLKNKELLQQLKNQDGLLSIALEAMEKSIPVKISLKSKKIYVGVIYSEQFEQMDFDNLIIIPYLSGYRDKDILRVVFDVNYTEFYTKKGLFNDEAVYKDKLLAEFRLSIRVSEIESISFFDKDAFDEMQLSTQQKSKKILVL